MKSPEQPEIVVKEFLRLEERVKGKNEVRGGRSGVSALTSAYDVRQKQEQKERKMNKKNEKKKDAGLKPGATFTP